MTEISIELPTAEELGRMQAAREKGLEFLQSELSVAHLPPDRGSIPTLQSLLDRIGMTEDRVWEPVGVLFGDILISEGDFRWAFIDGNDGGRRLALVRQTPDGGSQIVNLMQKLFELARSDTPAKLQAMFDAYIAGKPAE